ncbi:hypothetical protein Vadar_027855 [Vaccinium darrowii]|uniref:Uncharacterized protein n=1 Tax=Vaccinium darrowii TaxID=229202 RepID=A0ACB7XKF9_9ERIC|nr:hypothetical protein Vadar_027855 [Vaccinium darrowii]
MASSNNSESTTEQQIQHLKLKRNILALEIKLAKLALTEFEAETAQNHRILKTKTDGSVTNSAPMLFGSSGSPCSFTSAAATSSSQLQPVGSGDQMNMEDSMAEDQPVQASTPTIPAFGQIPISNPSSSGFMFSSAVPSAGNPFHFRGTQNQSTPQNPSPFQASSSLDFEGGGSSFSLGSGGVNKANRRIVRVKHKNRRR